MHLRGVLWEFIVLLYTFFLITFIVQLWPELSLGQCILASYFMLLLKVCTHTTVVLENCTSVLLYCT